MEAISPQIGAAWAAYSPSQREVLGQLRDMIWETARRLDLSIEESLKWGQASFVTPIGTPVRLGVLKSGHVGVFVHCQTKVLPETRQVFPDAFEYQGNRAISVPVDAPLDTPAMGMFLSLAMTYHRNRGK